MVERDLRIAKIVGFYHGFTPQWCQKDACSKDPIEGRDIWSVPDELPHGPATISLLTTIAYRPTRSAAPGVPTDVTRPATVTNRATKIRVMASPPKGKSGLNWPIVPTCPSRVTK